jgi:hypothetical protein
VAGSSKHGSYAGGREFYQIYYNDLPDVGRPMWFLARAKGDPWTVVRDLQNVLSSINPDLAMFNVSTMEDILGNTLRTHRLVEAIVSIFACFSFALLIPFEEELMHQTFGDPYDNYCRRVRRWL